MVYPPEHMMVEFFSSMEKDSYIRDNHVKMIDALGKGIWAKIAQTPDGIRRAMKCPPVYIPLASLETLYNDITMYRMVQDNVTKEHAIIMVICYYNEYYVSFMTSRTGSISVAPSSSTV